jgi:hypothetical protein
MYYGFGAVLLKVLLKVIKLLHYTKFDYPVPDFPATYTDTSMTESLTKYMKSAGEGTTAMEVEERVQEKIYHLSAAMDLLWSLGPWLPALDGATGP